jgi:hypothetical protein
VEGNAARIEGVVAVVAGGCSIAGIEGAAKTGAARVIYEPAVVAVVAAVEAVRPMSWARGKKIAAAAAVTAGIVVPILY